MSEKQSSGRIDLNLRQWKIHVIYRAYSQDREISHFPVFLFFTGYAIYSLYRMPKFPVLTSASA